MTPYKDILSEEQIKSVAEYVEELRKVTEASYLNPSSFYIKVSNELKFVMLKML